MAAAPPRIENPLPTAPEGLPPLPPLADSDRAASEMLVSLFGHEAFARFFMGDDVVRRFVATVDNLPRATAAQRLFPVRPVPGRFTATGDDETVGIAARQRRCAIARTCWRWSRWRRRSSRRPTSSYYPLFQAAYQELGYPDGYFNDRLVQAIDDMLAAPSLDTVALVQPKVLYQYADAGLEARSAGQKIMMRMGPPTRRA